MVETCCRKLPNKRKDEELFVHLRQENRAGKEDWGLWDSSNDYKSESVDRNSSFEKNKLSSKRVNDVPSKLQYSYTWVTYRRQLK